MTPTKFYIDAHLHILDVRFDTERENILKRAVASGVGKMICNAVSEKDWLGMAALAAKHPQVAACYGVHPWYADKARCGWLTRLEAFVQGVGCGVGEIGLDGLVEVEQKSQEEVFCAQLDLAVRLEKPVMIHCVKKWGKMVDIIEAYHSSSATMLFHSFGGSKEILYRLLDRGAYFSFSSLLADPAREKMRQVFQEVPVDRLLLETDAPDQYSPYLFDRDCVAKKVGKTVSEPGHIVRLYNLAANLRQMDIEVFTEQVWKNGQIFTN